MSLFRSSNVFMWSTFLSGFYSIDLILEVLSTQQFSLFAYVSFFWLDLRLVIELPSYTYIILYAEY